MFWVKRVNSSAKDTVSPDQVLTAACAEHWHLMWEDATSYSK